MSYCLNPSCPEPKNPPQQKLCQACGSNLLLYNRYLPVKKLGKGGFGCTFLVVDLRLPGHPCSVVKQLRPSMDDPEVFKMAKELFEREAQTLGKIGNHPQVPRLLDFFEENQQFYLVQEYVKGLNLQQEVKVNGPLIEAGIRQFLSEILPILHEIHSQKVIHRDIKPANIIRREQDRKLVLIDFGAVKDNVNTVAAKGGGNTALTAFSIGTAGFAPAEQMAMRPVYASDIYAVGVTCVYLLTGKSPKDLEADPSTGELMWEKYVQVTPQFAKVMKTMMEVAVRDRYKSAQEVLDALDMAPYEESLAQSMNTVIKSKPGSEKPSSSGFFQSPTTHGLRGAPPSPSPGQGGGGMGGGGMGGGGLPPRTYRARPTESQDQTVGSYRNQGSRTPSYKSTNNTTSGNSGRTSDRNSGRTSAQKSDKLDAKSILANYAKGNRDFAQMDLAQINLSDAKLPSVNFYGSKLMQINLQGADLTGADLGSANITKGQLKNACLSGAYLAYSNLEDCDMRGADLRFANLNYANLKGANLCGANLANARVTEVQLKQAKTNWATTLPTGKRSFM